MKIKKQPLISIVVLAYNNLDYTKLCINSIFKYASSLDFELITVNNGSTDGTKEYFDYLKNTKNVNLEENKGFDGGFNVGFKLANGKYILAVSNDVVLTNNSVDNLLKCIESDKKIGMVVPVCNYSSNMQQIETRYENLDDMHDFAKNYNIPNPKKWEERVRLIGYTWLIRRDLLKKIGWLDESFNPCGFDDDDLSFRVRREGYKLILAKDTFVHHFGSVTSTQDYKKYNLLARNREKFKRKFGVDAWEDANFDPVLVEAVLYKQKTNIDILGIDPLCGATILQIKNRFKQEGIEKINLYSISQEEKYTTDLKTVSNCIIWDDINKIRTYFKESMFDYIIIEKSLEQYKNIDFILNSLKGIVKKDGQIIFSIKNPAYYMNVVNLIQDNLKVNNDEYSISYIEKYKFANKLNNMGYKITKIIEKRIQVPPSDKSLVENIQMCFLDKDVQKVKVLLNTYAYIFSVEKNE